MGSMKLAFSTLGCPDWGWAQILKNAKEMGFDGIEIRGLEGEMRPERMARFLPGRQQDTLRELKARGLVLTDIGTSAMFHDPDKLSDALDEGRAAIDVCARMGIPFIRVFGDRVPDPAHEADTVRQVVGGIQALCDYAEGTGVGVLIEAHGEFNVASRLAAVLESVGRDSFGILWDIGNSDDDCGDEFERFYEPFRPYIRHIHVKDQLRDEKHTLTHIGKGQIPIGPIVRRLRDDGFDGFLSLEWEKKWNPWLDEPEVAFPEYVSYIKEALAK